MKFFHIPFFYIILLTLLFTSCSPYFYAPNTAQVPLFREKGEKQISGHLGIGDVILPSVQVQAAAAIDSHLAVMGSIYSATGRKEVEEKDIIFSGIPIPISTKNTYLSKVNQAEFAIGYFKTKSAHWSVELYGGLTYGIVTNSYSREYQNGSNFKVFPFKVNTDYIKPFVQKNWGYRSEYFDFILNLRLAYLQVGNIKEIHKTDPGFVPISSDETIDYITKNPKSLLLEPGLTFRAGKEPLKAQLHIGTSFNIIDLFYPQEFNVITLGVVYNLGFKL